MIKDLQIFKNEEFGQVRVIEKKNEPWFVAKDVCNILEIKNSRDAVTRLDDDEKGVVLTDTLGGKQNLSIVNEYGLYSLILSSRKPEAKRFKRWITHEVIPSIRKHGGYLTPDKIEEALLNPDTLIQLATNLKEEQQRRLQAENQIEMDKPKVLFAEAVENSNNVILVKEMATILTQRGFNIGQNQLFEFLRKNEYLCKREGNMYNLPTKRYEHFFKVTKRIIQHSNGSVIKNTPKITGKGQLYFVKKFDEYLEKGLTVKKLLEEVQSERKKTS